MGKASEIGVYNRTIICPTLADYFPTKVMEDIRRMWEDYEAGNDYYYINWLPEHGEDYPHIAEFIKQHNLDEDNILIHFWW